MSLLQLAASGGAAPKHYVDDVFSTFLYTGNGSTQTITNGIDLAGKGGLVWVGTRSSPFGHYLFDTDRGLPNRLSTHNGNAQGTISPAFISSFNSNGFSTQNDTGSTGLQTNGLSGVTWTFRKAPKFFDVVTWTGNATNRTIAHSLGQEVGLIYVKRTNTTADWQVYHRSLANTEYMVLNSTAAKATGATRWNSATATSSVFSVGTDASVNASGGTYVAYLFAHDTSADGIIQCGSFVGNPGVSVNLGWEPQYVLAKASGTTSDWFIVDSSRGMPVGTPEAGLYANTSAAESGLHLLDISATGFTNNAGFGGVTLIYLAIRRPNKPPTSGTQVYFSSTASGVITTDFPVDLRIGATRATPYHRFVSRLTGGTKELVSWQTAAESTATDYLFDSNDGLRVSVPSGQINHYFKRAPGFLDVVCDNGTGSVHTIPHNLGVIPELMIRKKRSATDNWIVYAGDATDYLILNTTAATADLNTMWNDTAPTSSVFTVGSDDDVNQNTGTFITYLFASLAGISKVGTYTGNGSSQAINCGFAAGARFILIKRTDSTGNWYIWDSARGIIAANDPHVNLNSDTAEVTTDDSVDPDSSGFIVNQVAATNINVTSASYIYLAIS